MDKKPAAFASSSEHLEVDNELPPPPPYPGPLPQEFVNAGLKEDDFQMVAEYEGVCGISFYNI